MITLDRPDIKPFWSNCKDSLRHAGEHFSELSMTNKQKNPQEHIHHSKWVVLSVAHAADYYLRIFLKELEPSCHFLNNPENGPSLSKTITHLKNKHGKDLQGSRERIIEVIDEVNKQRDKIMHRYLPEDLTEAVSDAAWAFFGLLRSIRTEYKINTDTIVDYSPSIETDSFSLIMRSKHQDFMNYVVQSLAESPGPEDLDYCPLCGTLSVLEGNCEICFQGFRETECEQCGEQYYVPDDSVLAHHLGLDVCSCGAIL